MAFKKAKKVVKAVYGGTKEYSAQVRDIDRRAQAAVGQSGSRNADIWNQAKLRKEMMKKEGVSWGRSIRKRL